VLTGENNIGSVTVDGHKITHVLLSRGQRTTAQRAEPVSRYVTRLALFRNWTP
jgi:hypothetical protein